MPREKKKTRRGNNEGSIFQRKDGKWVGEVMYGYKPDGKPNRKTYYGKTREDVAQKVAKAVNEAFNGVQPIDNKRITTGQYMKDWLEMFKRPEVTTRTYEWYRNVVINHIIPALGIISLQKLTTFHIQSAIAELQQKGYSHRTVKTFRSTLIHALKQAQALGMINENPAVNTKLQRKERDPNKETVKALPVDLRIKVLEVAEKDVIMKPIVTTLMFTEMRSGELLALRWSNIDFTNRKITIDSATTIIPEYDSSNKPNGRKTAISVPKTEAGYRTIKAPQSVMDALLEWKSHIDNTIPNHSEFVFCSTKTGELRSYQGFKASFRHFLERNSLTEYNITLHRFRHSFATMLLESNVNPRVVQRLLGHADIQTTLGIYSHVMSEVFDDVADTLGSLHIAMTSGT